MNRYDSLLPRNCHGIHDMWTWVYSEALFDVSGSCGFSLEAVCYDPLSCVPVVMGV